MEEFNISKEELEKELGIELLGFEIMGPIEDGVISIRVVPKRAVQYINHKFTITPSGSTFFEE